MKFSVDTAALSTELALALGASSQKGDITQKSLTHVKLTASDLGVLTIQTHSVDIAFQATIEAQVDVPGVVMMEAKKVSDHVSFQIGDRIAFEVKSSAGRVSVRSGKNRSTIPCFPDSDLPAIESHRSYVGNVSLDTLALMLNRVAFAISTEDASYHITAAKLQLGDAGIMAVATDAKKLSLTENPTELLNKADSLIPRKTIAELVKIHSKSAGSEVKIAIDKKGSLFFDIGHRTLFSLGVSGKFPNHNVCFMKGDRARVIVKANTFKSTIERVGNFADNQSFAMTFTLSPGSLTVSASHHDTGEAEEDIDVEYDGKKISVALSSKNIMDFLRLAGDRNIELAFLNSMSPVEFRVEDDPTWVVVVMPMKL